MLVVVFIICSNDFQQNEPYSRDMLQVLFIDTFELSVTIFFLIIF
jgi:hypothetical protein